MKQFNLQEYLENPNRKVVTRDGRETRIKCTDVIGTSLPIIALVKNPETLEEKIVLYTPEGRAAYLNEGLDLFFADEDARKHEGWINLATLIPEEEYLDNPFQIRVFETKAEALKEANKAEKCFSKQGDVVHYRSVKIEWEE